MSKKKKRKKQKSGGKSRAAVVIILLLAVTVIFQFVPVPFSAGISLFGAKQKQIAHRGLSGAYPEQTEDAYIAAGLAGFYGAECDVHTTKDGKLIIMHDDTVDRTTDGEGKIEDMTLEELSALTIDAGHGIENCVNKKVLLFTEYLEICEKYSMVPFIELKKLDVAYLPDMFAAIEKYGFSDSAVLISFSFDYLIAARELNADMKMMYLSGNLKKDEVETCREYNFGLDFDFLKLIKFAGAFSYAKQSGLELAAWTVDMPLVADFLHLIGVDYVTTNRLTPAK